MKKFLLFVVLLVSMVAKAQPANDLFEAALTAVTNTSNTCLQINNVTLTGATPSSNLTSAMNSCGSSGAPVDVWYKFTAESSAYQIAFSNFSAFIRYTLAQGSNAETLTPVKCGSVNSTKVIITELTVGAEYFIRVSSNSSAPQISTEMCLFAIPAQTNDNCSDATQLAVNPTMEAASTVNGILGAVTASSSPSNPACIFSTVQDVWYKFTATSNRHNVQITSSAMSQLRMLLYNGDCTSPGTPVCNSQLLYGLVPGQIYLIKLVSTSPNLAEFSIAVVTPPEVVNDNCNTAVTIPVNNDSTVTQFVESTLAGATLSTNAAPCTASYTRDIWFSFTATSNSHAIDIFDKAWGPTVGIAVTLFNGSCGSLQSTSCYSAASTNLVVGDTYLVRVATSSDLIANGSFKIAVITLVNDECSQAIALPVSQSSACIPSPRYSVSLATSSGYTNCNTTQNDVWFEFTATNASHIIKLTGGTSLRHSLYSGTCGSLVHIGCSNFSQLIKTYNNLIVGATYRIGVHYTTNPEPFTICVLTGENVCTDASQFVSGYNSYLFDSETNVPSSGTMGCLTATPNIKWFAITTANAGTLTYQVTINKQFDSYGNPTGQAVDCDYILYGPFQNLAQACATKSAANTISCSYSTSSVENFTIQSTAAGQVYLLGVTNYNGQPSKIKITQTAGLPSVPVGMPAGAVNQDFESGDTLADLEVQGQNIQWYDNPGQSTGRSVNEMNQDEPLPLTTLLVDGETYYASQTIYGIESLNRLPVTVNMMLGNNDNVFHALKYYPNPAQDIFTISNNTIIDKVEIHSLTGQLVKSEKINTETLSLNIADLKNGIYMVKVGSGNAEKTIKLMKQ